MKLRQISLGRPFWLIECDEHVARTIPSSFHSIIVHKASVNRMRATTIADGENGCSFVFRILLCFFVTPIGPSPTICTFYLILIESINEWMQSLAHSLRTAIIKLIMNFTCSCCRCIIIMNSSAVFMFLLVGANKHKRKFATKRHSMWPCVDWMRRTNRD